MRALRRDAAARQPAPPSFPDAAERSYRAYLRRRARLREQVAREVILSKARAVGVPKRRDAVDLATLLTAVKIASVVFGGKAPVAVAVLARFARATDIHAEGQVARALRAALAIGLPAVDPPQLSLFDSNRPLFEGWIQGNVELIGGLDERFFDDVTKRVQSTVESGASLDALSAELQAAGVSAGKRADFIARDQVATFNAQVTRARLEAVGVTAYIWSTSRDGNVREEHADRDGEIIRYSDPPDDGHAGEPIGCRCVQRAYFGPV